jgi:hypothetical protein
VNVADVLSCMYENRTMTLVEIVLRRKLGDEGV